jgi:glycerol uptake facilitator-like aquaporin
MVLALTGKPFAEMAASASSTAVIGLPSALRSTSRHSRESSPLAKYRVRRYVRRGGMASGLEPGENSRIVASMWAKTARWRSICSSNSRMLPPISARLRRSDLMFELPLWQLSITVRTGSGQWLAEAVATFGLLLTIFGCVARTLAAVPYAVGLYITAAYWFTASTSFANPAVTIARSLSDTFAGIAPAGVAAFIAAQLAGMIAAVVISSWLWPTPAKAAGPRSRWPSMAGWQAL